MKKIYSIFTILCISLLMFSCSSELDEKQEIGYLKLSLKTLVSTNTRAVTNVPSGYNAKTLSVKITNNEGTVVAQTDDFENDATMKKNLELLPGEYTITASSAGWDGSGSGFDAPYYTGSTKATVTAKTLTTAQLTLTQANVKVTVNFADNLSTYFTSASCIVTSATTGVAAQTFDFKTAAGSAYFPVADLKFFLTLTNKLGKSYSMAKTVTDVKARDHYIINYKIADAGSLGGVTVKVDDATQEYSFTVEIPRKAGTALEAKKANAWSNFADLSAEVTSKTQSFDASLLKLQWKKVTDEAWTEVSASALVANGDKYSYRLKELQPGTNYMYRMHYADADNPVYSNEVTFTTEKQTGIYNGGFENWYIDGSNSIAGNKNDNKYWDSSNAGASGFIGSVTTQETKFVHGGNSSAKLATNSAVGKLAAASLFTGNFIGLVSTKGAKLDWGVPFDVRPSALKGYMAYAPGAINIGKQPEGIETPAKGGNDACQIYCVLVTEQFHVANTEVAGYEMSTTIDWQNDPRVVAYGELTQNTSDNGAWKAFNIPLTYHSLTAKPTQLIIVCSASKWGDYFYGSNESVLYLDDFEFEYGEPTTK